MNKLQSPTTLYKATLVTKIKSKHSFEPADDPYIASALRILAVGFSTFLLLFSRKSKEWVSKLRRSKLRKQTS